MRRERELVLMVELAAIAITVLAFSLLSGRLQDTLFSGPIWFLTAGILFGSNLLGLVDFGEVVHIFLAVGVVALALSFFNQASRINPAALLGSIGRPVRLLLIGLPLTIIAGMLVASWLFPELTWIEAALLATVLAPADSGLIPAVLSSERVPMRIRQALNVESSLNDGITTPFAVLFMVLAQRRFGAEAIALRLAYPLTQIALALLVGVVVGGVGGWLFRKADQKRAIGPGFESLVFPSLTMIALPLAYLLKANYFIACFVAGITTAFVLGDYSERHSRFSETLDQLLSLVVLLILGTEFNERLGDLDWRIFLYALLSLTLVRMLPVSIALLGRGLRRESVLFLGWFGPRGLASIVLGALVLLNVSGIPHAETIALVVMTTVVLSVFLHGASSIPLVVWYGRRVATFAPDAPENQPVVETPVHMGWSQYLVRTEQRLSGWEARILRKRGDDHTGNTEGTG